MSGNTTNFSIQYPTSTDLVKDGAVAIQTVAQGFDTRLGNVATYPNQIVNVVSGVSRPIPYATNAGTVTIGAPAALNTLATVAVTFAASRFTQAPIVNISTVTANTNPRALKADAITTSGFTAGQWQLAGGTFQSTSAHWVAIQMTSAAAAG
jgi:hypothetical protein